MSGSHTVGFFRVITRGTQRFTLISCRHLLCVWIRLQRCDLDAHRHPTLSCRSKLYTLELKRVSELRVVCGERNSSCSSSFRSSGKMPAMAWCQAVRKYVMLPPLFLPPADFAAAASRFPGPLGPPEPLDLRRAAFYARREEHAHVEAQAFMTLRRFQVPVEEMTDEDFAN